MIISDLQDRWLLLPVLLLVLLSACAPARLVDVEEVVPDTTVGAQPVELTDYRVLEHRREDFSPRVPYYDILHTELDLEFDFEDEIVIGVATHRLTPLQPGTDSLVFDAVHMEIGHVTLTHAGWTDTLITRSTASGFVAYPVEALRDIDTVEVSISYRAHPGRADGIRGLHFVDGAGVDPSLPTQIWTLSQPEDARFWFPTWDYPNDFMSFTIRLTVPSEFDTVANGDLASQDQDGDLRTDTWLFDQPHVPYLAAFAVGDFVTVEDSYVRADGSAVPLRYIVEEAYADEAPAIFGETSAMMDVFERQTGLRYPWNDYKQVVVQEFSAGGMEHTTMSTLSSRVLRDARARLDQTARNLIAHELVHQWFGNLVTSENWAHLALNEGFAQYFETVYLQDAIGADEAQEHAMRSLQSYLDEARTLRRPIIWYGYDDPYELYDRHTYAKAARVLNQLRFELGEDAWWEGVRSYLRDNRHRNVVAEDLQRTMEAASGRDLGRFFEQWFYSPGHPELLVEHSVDDATGLYKIRVRQTQDTSRTSLFTFDAEFEVRYKNRQPFFGRVTVETADTTFQIGTAGEIDYVRFDAGAQLLADIRTQKPLGEWIAQAKHSPEMAARYEAVGILAEQSPSQLIRNALLVAMRDPYDLVRLRAVEAVATYAESDASARRALIEQVSNDPSSRVRAGAIRSLRKVSEDESLIDAAIHEALHDSSYTVTATAIGAFGERRLESALDAYAHLLKLESYSGIIERALASAIPNIVLDERIELFIDGHSRPVRQVEARLAVAGLLGKLTFEDPAGEVRHEAVMRLLVDVDERVRYRAAQAIASRRYVIDEAALSERIEAEPSPRVRSVLEDIGAAEPTVNQ